MGNDNTDSYLLFAIEECKSEARLHGYEDEWEWEPTRRDLECIVKQFSQKYGRMPTRTEWQEVGYPKICPSFCANEDTDGG